MSGHPIIRQSILAALNEHGPLTALELTEAAHLTRKQIDHALYQAKGKDYWHITSWRRQEPGVRGDIAPVYKAGPGKNAPKPPRIPHKERNAAYRERKRAQERVRARRDKGVKPRVFQDIVLTLRKYQTV